MAEMAQMQSQLQELVSRVQALTQDLSIQSEALRQSEADRQSLHEALHRAQARQDEMTGAMTLVLRQQGSGKGVASEADASRTLQHVDVMKAVKAPQSLKDRDGWERFVFQVETYLAFIDGEMYSWIAVAKRLRSWIRNKCPIQ